VSDEPPPFGQIRVPVLALVSRRAAFADPAIVRRSLEALSDCEIVELEAQHWIPTEQPEAMRAAIEDWLARRF